MVYFVKAYILFGIFSQNKLIIQIEISAGTLSGLIRLFLIKQIIYDPYRNKKPLRRYLLKLLENPYIYFLKFADVLLNFKKVKNVLEINLLKPKL